MPPIPPKNPGDSAITAALAASAQDDAKYERRSEAADYFNATPHGKTYRCPICNDNDWGVNDTAILPIRINTDPASGIGQSVAAFPLVPITCFTCGYTFFLNEHWVRNKGRPPYAHKEEAK